MVLELVEGLYEYNNNYNTIALIDYMFYVNLSLVWGNEYNYIVSNRVYRWPRNMISNGCTEFVFHWRNQKKEFCIIIIFTHQRYALCCMHIIYDSCSMRIANVNGNVFCVKKNSAHLVNDAVCTAILY